MGQKKFILFLTAEAVCCLAAVLLPGLAVEQGSWLMALLAFPFAQLGQGLRWLSLSGGLGNGAAICLYLLICLLPLGGLALLWRRSRRIQPGDALLVVLSALLFGVLYLMVNPDLLSQWLNVGAQGAMGKALLGGAVYSVLAGWLVLRALGLFLEADRRKLQRCLNWLLVLLAVVFVAAAFAGGGSALMERVSSLRAGNQGNEALLGSSCVFLALRAGVNSLPYVLDVLVILWARQLLGQLERDRYAPEAVAAAEKLSRVCVWSLGIAVVSNVALQLLQLLCARWLFTLDALVQFPLLSMAFVLGVLLLAQYVRENKQLKDDNDLFV